MNETLPKKEFSYGEKINASIRDLLLEFECQPILFIGSGLSRRYINLPNWMELLKALFESIPDQSGRFEYYRQKYDGDPIKIGTALSDVVFEWAWQTGKNKFPADFFQKGKEKDCFVKYLCCDYIKNIILEASKINTVFKSELDALSAIRPHAIITTNYDLFLEQIFDGYQPITGQTILKYNANSFGEIFHVHGDISDPSTIVLTEKDYAEWSKKKKYVSAKLLTYFAEHPVFIIGYGIGDPNVKEILMDIGEIVADEDGLIPNVYQVIWIPEGGEKSPPDSVILTADGREYKIKAIYSNSFEWIFNALKGRSALSSINLKLVRALAARTMKLIRQDIPSGRVSVNYDVLERIASQNDELPSLLGISSISNPNQSHPLTISQVATRLGFSHWMGANKLVNKIKEDKGIDLRSTDNAYHCKIKTGARKASLTRKWSLKSVDLLKKVMDGEDYEVEI